MPQNKNDLAKYPSNVQDSPGTSDRGQLTASITPVLPAQPKADPYVPPPAPQPVMGKGLDDSERKLGYRVLAASLPAYDEKGERQAVADYIHAKYGKQD